MPPPDFQALQQTFLRAYPRLRRRIAHRAEEENGTL